MTIEVQSLAVKYRPRSITGLVGQEAIVDQIKGMVLDKRFPAALLLSGSSGCGKTTTTRIIANTVNCSNLDLKTFTPCGECQSCRLGKESPDYSEIDTADTRGIDFIRSLIQSAKSMPMVSNNRIIVVDECFPGDTEIEISPGEFVRLDSIKTGDSILSYDLSSQCLETDVVEGTENKVIENLIRVWLDDGSYQDCSPNHKWWSVTKSKMVRADQLVEGEEFLPLSSIQDSTN